MKSPKDEKELIRSARRSNRDKVSTIRRSVKQKLESMGLNTKCSGSGCKCR